MKVHFSVDDIFGSLWWLKENRAASIFDSFVFRNMRELHDLFGVKISAYCIFRIGKRCLSEIPDTWSSEFYENRHWLSFGFHGLHENSDYNEQTGEQIREDYNRLAKEIRRITAHERLDEWIRIHYFSGNRDVTEALRACGVTGLLAADDTRISYGLNKSALLQLQRDGYWFDQETKMNYYRTDFRVENIRDENLENFMDELKKQDRLIFFTHEHYLEDESVMKHIKMIFERVLQLSEGR